MAFRSKSPVQLDFSDIDDGDVGIGNGNGNGNNGNSDSDGDATDIEENSPVSRYIIDSPIVKTSNDTLNSLLGDVTNYDNIDDDTFGKIFGQQIGDGKIKQQFVQKKDGSGRGLGVRLEYYKNNNDADYGETASFTKMFIYSKDLELEPSVVLEKILQEVFYHKEFSKVHEACGFEMPEILKYGFVTKRTDSYLDGDSDNDIHHYVFYIKMSYVDSISVTNKYTDDVKDAANAKCNIIKTRVEKIGDCLEKKGLYHNDLHSDNVMIDKNGNILLIDFGEASNRTIQN